MAHATRTHLEWFLVWTELPGCYVLCTYPVRWAGQANHSPVVRMESQNLGEQNCCEEVETRERESLFHGHTATQWLSLDSDPDEVTPNPELPHPAQLPLKNTASDSLHPGSRDVFLSVRTL